MNDFYDVFEQNFPFDAYGLNWCESKQTKKSNYFKFKCEFFTVINMTNNILNNIIFLIISVIIDVSLIRIANENLRSKKAVFSDDETHLDEAIKFKEKINKMIIVNGFFSFISHFPEFLTTLLLIIFRHKLEYYCFTLFSCVDLIEISQSLIFVFIFLQFFLFKKFDKNFRDSFDNIWNRLFTPTSR